MKEGTEVEHSSTDWFIADHPLLLLWHEGDIRFFTLLAPMAQV